MGSAAALVCSALPTAHSQAFAKPTVHTPGSDWAGSICENSTLRPAARNALRLACHDPSIVQESVPAQEPLIVVGFVGGFVSPEDMRHPEPLFALLLRQRYGAQTRARVFSNHDEGHAWNWVLHLLDTDRDGVISSGEKHNAKIVIYGHSWGASEAAAFARDLGRLQIPVMLTAQVDIVAKPGQMPELIPPNVAHAVNFFQTGGMLHGRQEIVARDPARTVILGNVRMDYAHAPVNCDNYNWLARFFNRSHYEIENDPRVWDQIASLIDAEVGAGAPPAAPQSSVRSGAPADSSAQR